MLEETISIVVTTGDLHRPYEVIGPVFYQISNKGIFSSTYGRMMKEYGAEIERLRNDGAFSHQTNAGVELFWALAGDFSVGQNQFDSAFFIAVSELRKRAARLSANAIIGMRQDIDLDTTGFTFFYLQMYGTAVRYTTIDVNEEIPTL